MVPPRFLINNQVIKGEQQMSTSPPPPLSPFSSQLVPLRDRSPVYREKSISLAQAPHESHHTRVVVQLPH